VITITAWILTHKLLTAGGIAIGAPILSFLGWLASKLGEFIGKAIFGYFFVCKELNDDFTTNILVHFITREKPGFSVNRETYDARRVFVHSADRDGILMTRKNNKSFRLLFYKGVPLLLTPQIYRSGAENSPSSIRFFRGSVNWDQLVCAAARKWDEDILTTPRQYSITRHTGTSGPPKDNAPSGETGKTSDSNVVVSGGLEQLLNWKEEDLKAPPSDSPLNILSISKEMAKVIREVKFWLSHREWYKRKDIAWRRGYLLYGRPGNGKTSLVRGLAEELDIPVHVFDLASMDDREFIQAWGSARANRPRIVLFEDFDTVFEGRVNKIEGSSLDFSTILNAIDGLEREDGLLLFVTTNNLAAIDPAMGIPDENGDSTRPGRIDDTIELPGLDLDGKRKMATRILDDELEVEKLVVESGDDTAAQFQERCVKVALSHLWGAQ
jgi:hypothetical protein